MKSKDCISNCSSSKSGACDADELCWLGDSIKEEAVGLSLCVLITRYQQCNKRTSAKEAEQANEEKKGQEVEALGVGGGRGRGGGSQFEARIEEPIETATG